MSRNLKNDSTKPKLPNKKIGSLLLATLPIDVILLCVALEFQISIEQAYSLLSPAFISLAVALFAVLNLRKITKKSSAPPSKNNFIKPIIILMGILVGLKPLIAFWQISKGLLIIPLGIAFYVFSSTYKAGIKVIKESDKNTTNRRESLRVVGLIAARVFAALIACSLGIMPLVHGIICLILSEFLAAALIFELKRSS